MSDAQLDTLLAVTEYDVVQSDAVNDFIEAGWQPHGSAILDNGVVVQPMVRKKLDLALMENVMADMMALTIRLQSNEFQDIVEARYRKMFGDPENH